MSEIVYSQTRRGLGPGQVQLNPRHFQAPRADASKVYFIGDWPKIEAAYTALGVPVERLDAAPAVEPPPAAVMPLPTLPVEARAEVEIPQDWRDLSWPQVRSLAAQFASEPVLNKAQAVDAVEAELARRA
jgi:hypothetical protein